VTRTSGAALGYHTDGSRASETARPGRDPEASRTEKTYDDDSTHAIRPPLERGVTCIGAMSVAGPLPGMTPLSAPVPGALRRRNVDDPCDRGPSASLGGPRGRSKSSAEQNPLAKAPKSNAPRFLTHCRRGGPRCQAELDCRDRRTGCCCRPPFERRGDSRAHPSRPASRPSPRLPCPEASEGLRDDGAAARATAAHPLT